MLSRLSQLQCETLASIRSFSPELVEKQTHNYIFWTFPGKSREPFSPIQKFGIPLTLGHRKEATEESGMRNTPAQLAGKMLTVTFFGELEYIEPRLKALGV